MMPRAEPSGRCLPPAVLLALSAGPFLSMLDSNILSVAVPSIARQLHTQLDVAQWTLSAYLLALAVALPATSYVSRRFGTVRSYLGALLAFTFVSGLCAVAPNITALIGLRVLQGTVGAALVPLAMELLYSRDLNNGGSAVGSLLFFLAPTVGPSIGGLMLDTVGWRLLFLVNVPAGLAAFGVLLRKTMLLPSASRRNREVRLDVLGFTLIGAGLGSLIYATTEAPRVGWTSFPVLILWPIGLAFLLAYWIYSRHNPNVAVRIDLLHSGPMTISTGLTALVSVVLFGVLFLAPVFLQDAAHRSALDAGLVLLPQGFAMGLSIGIGRRAASFVGLRLVVAGGLMMLGLSTGLLLLVTTSTPLLGFAAILTGRGFAMGFAMTPLLDALLPRLPITDLSDATTLFNISQRLGGSIGIAAIASFYAARLQSGIQDASRNLAGGPTFLRDQLSRGASLAVPHAADAAFQLSALVLTALALVGLLALPLLPRRDWPSLRGPSKDVVAPSRHSAEVSF